MPLLLCMSATWTSFGPGLLPPPPALPAGSGRGSSCGRRQDIYSAATSRRPNRAKQDQSGTIDGQADAYRSSPRPLPLQGGQPPGNLTPAPNGVFLCNQRCPTARFLDPLPNSRKSSTPSSSSMRRAARASRARKKARGSRLRSPRPRARRATSAELNLTRQRMQWAGELIRLPRAATWALRAFAGLCALWTVVGLVDAARGGHGLFELESFWASPRGPA